MDDLTKLRNQIDKVDNQLLDLLAKRVELVNAVGMYKAQNHITIVDKAREKEIIKQKVERAQKLGLRVKFVIKIWEIIFKEAYFIEE